MKKLLLLTLLLVPSLSYSQSLEDRKLEADRKLKAVVSNYNQELYGLTETEIAEFLYEQDFKRTYDIEKSVTVTIYTKKYYFGYNYDYLVITIKTWYSFGFENFYYQVTGHPVIGAGD